MGMAIGLLAVALSSCAPRKCPSILAGCDKPKSTLTAPIPRRERIDPERRRRFLREHGRTHFMFPNDPFYRWLQEERQDA